MRPFLQFCIRLAVGVTLLAACDQAPVDPLGPDGIAAARGGGTQSGLAAPTGVLATAVSTTGITVAWQDNSGDETRFDIFRSLNGANGAFVLLASVGANVTQHADNGLSSGQQYCYRVSSVKVTGKKTATSAPSSAACATTPTTPAPPPTVIAAPTNAVAEAGSESTIDLTWEDNSTGESSYIVYRSNPASPGNWIQLPYLPPDSESYTDVGLNAAIEYCYRVRVVGDATGEWSNTTCATTLGDAAAPPPVVTGITAAGTSPWWDGGYADSPLEIHWSAVEASNLLGYRIYASSDGGATWTHKATTPQTSFYDWTTPDQIWCYRIVAYNGVEGPPSAMACAALPASPVLSESRSDGMVHLTWTDNSSVETGYEVYVYTAVRMQDYTAGLSEWYLLVAALPAGSTSHSFAEYVDTDDQYFMNYVVIAVTRSAP